MKMIKQTLKIFGFLFLIFLIELNLGCDPRNLIGANFHGLFTGSISRVFPVTTAADFSSAISLAATGDRIVIANGTYSDWAVTIPNTLNGVTIEPQTEGGVTFTRSDNTALTPLFAINSNGNTVKNLNFANCGARAIQVNGSYNTIIGNTFSACGHPDDQVKAILSVNEASPAASPAVNNDIEANTFDGSLSISVSVIVNMAETAHPVNNIITKNIFENIDHNVAGVNNGGADNGREAVQLGQFGTWYITLNSVVSENTFLRVNGDPELISIKTSGNTIQDNLCYESRGLISMRFTDNSTVQRNKLIRCGGITMSGSGHKVINNYLYQPLNGGINISSARNNGGRDNAPPAANPNGPWCYTPSTNTYYFEEAIRGPCDYRDRFVESSTAASPICQVLNSGSTHGSVGTFYYPTAMADSCNGGVDRHAGGAFDRAAIGNYIANNTVVGGGHCPINANIKNIDCWVTNGPPSSTSDTLNGLFAFNIFDESPPEFARNNVVANNIFHSAISGASGVVFTSMTATMVGSSTIGAYASMVALGIWTLPGQFANQRYIRNVFSNMYATSSASLRPPDPANAAATNLTGDPGFIPTGAGYSLAPWSSSVAPSDVKAAGAWDYTLSTSGSAAHAGFAYFGSDPTLLPSGFTVNTSVTTDMVNAVRPASPFIGAQEF